MKAVVNLTGWATRASEIASFHSPRFALPHFALRPERTIDGLFHLIGRREPNRLVWPGALDAFLGRAGLIFAAFRG